LATAVHYTDNPSYLMNSTLAGSLFINVSAFDRYVTSSLVVEGSFVSFVLIDAITISGNGRLMPA
jgi:hypothetical protein